MRGMQRAISWIYPPQCPICAGFVEEQGGLCPDCWRQTPFLAGLVCHACGCVLPGQSEGAEFCDDCLSTPRPWQAGRAAVAYRDYGRRIVLSLKHGDRPELAKPAAEWMWKAGRSILPDTALLVPVPVHWSRLLRRRYNQSAELARFLGQVSGLSVLPDALIRVRRTQVQDRMTVEERRRNMAGAITVKQSRAAAICGEDICLVDDVMTSGATLTACSDALHSRGAGRVFILVLARAEKNS